MAFQCLTCPLLLFQEINSRETLFQKVSTGLIKHVLSHFQRESAGIHFAKTSVFSGHGVILRILLDNRFCGFFSFLIYPFSVVIPIWLI